MGNDMIESLRTAIRALHALRAEVPDAVGQVDEVLTLLAEVEAQLGRQVSRVRRRRGDGVSLEVEKLAGREVLTERRAGGKSKPFRVGREVFDVLVGVLAQADPAPRYEDLVGEVEKQVAPKPRDFQLRMLLRFLMRAGLVKRVNGRYLAQPEANLKKFQEGARKAWTRASKQ